jgi:2-polyprenyl-3-methyl-5-hydroxy-6-metoxy-1,4-benzoquinol methylase
MKPSKINVPYETKYGRFSSHDLIARSLLNLKPKTILDLGCSQGEFAAHLKSLMNVSICGVDYIQHEGVSGRVDSFYLGDLNSGIPSEIINKKFDALVIADVLEHLVDPYRLLEELKNVMGVDSEVFISLPNVGHWYPRFTIFFGRFPYSDRGIFDRTHVKFLTRSTALELCLLSGLEVKKISSTTTPWELIVKNPLISKFLARLESSCSKVLPRMFSYQFVFQLGHKINGNSRNFKSL